MEIGTLRPLRAYNAKGWLSEDLLFSHHNLNYISSRASVTTADAGQCVSFALKRVRRSAVRKGMVIVAKTETPPKGACTRFILSLYLNIISSLATSNFIGQVLIL